MEEARSVLQTTLLAALSEVATGDMQSQTYAH